LKPAGLINAPPRAKCCAMTEARDMADSFLDRLGRFLARRLHSANAGYEPYTPSDPTTLSRTLQPGDIVLVEGNQKVSAAIKYLTQSTWSHAALYVGDALKPDEPSGPDYPQLVEVNLGEGCVAVPLSKYSRFNTRICRPVGLTPEDRAAVVSYMVERLGVRYDMKNIFDLLRYFFPTPPVPVRWRRRMIAFGSGDPDPCHLLLDDRPGLPVGSLPDPAGGDTRSRQAKGGFRVLPAGNPSHPAPFPVRAAGFRPLALLQGCQTDARIRLRLQGSRMGAQAIGSFARTEGVLRGCRLTIPCLRREIGCNKGVFMTESADTDGTVRTHGRVFHPKILTTLRSMMVRHFFRTWAPD
jgi:hypothetical protein